MSVTAYALVSQVRYRELKTRIALAAVIGTTAWFVAPGVWPVVWFVAVLASQAVDWAVFIVPYRAASALPVVGPLAQRVGPQRLKVYAEYPFQVVYADWFDRLAAPIRFYYDDRAMQGWLERAHLGRTAISPTGLFGWRAYGERS